MTETPEDDSGFTQCRSMVMPGDNLQQIPKYSGTVTGRCSGRSESQFPKPSKRVPRPGNFILPGLDITMGNKTFAKDIIDQVLRKGEYKVQKSAVTGCGWAINHFRAWVASYVNHKGLGSLTITDTGEHLMLLLQKPEPAAQ